MKNPFESKTIQDAHNKRMQSYKVPSTREVEQGHECLSWVGNRLSSVISGGSALEKLLPMDTAKSKI